jgi:hypothetical protein
MSAAASMQANATAVARTRSRGSGPRPTTLLELVRSISEVTDDDHEIVATVLHLLRTRQVRLCGILRDRRIEELG